MNTNENDEREFLHDLASPIATALFITDAVLEGIQARSHTDPEELIQVKQLYDALEKARSLLHERRETLIKRGVPSART
jgi:hypothetical protein